MQQFAERLGITKPPEQYGFSAERDRKSTV